MKKKIQKIAQSTDVCKGGVIEGQNVQVNSESLELQSQQNFKKDGRFEACGKSFCKFSKPKSANIQKKKDGSRLAEKNQFEAFGIYLYSLLFVKGRKTRKFSKIKFEEISNTGTSTSIAKKNPNLRPKQLYSFLKTLIVVL